MAISRTISPRLPLGTSITRPAISVPTDSFVRGSWCENSKSSEYRAAYMIVYQLFPSVEAVVENPPFEYTRLPGGSCVSSVPTAPTALSRLFFDVLRVPMRFLRSTHLLLRPLRMHARSARGLGNVRSGMIYSAPLVSSLGADITVKLLITYIF